MSVGGDRGALDSLVRATLDRAGLRGARRERVARELRAHLNDALDDATPIEQIVAEFGDPQVVGSLIRKHPPVRRSRTVDVSVRAACAALASFIVVAAVTYGCAAVRLGTFHLSLSRNDWLDSVASVAQTRQHVAAGLRAENRATVERLETIEAAVSIAGRLTQRTDAFGAAVAASISLDVLDASESLATSRFLSIAERRRLSADLRSLADYRTSIDSLRETKWIADIARQSFDDEHRPSSQGLRVARAMKGVRRPTLRARLFEPVLFANAASGRRRWNAMVSGHFAEAHRATSNFRARIESTLATIDAHRGREPQK